MHGKNAPRPRENAANKEKRRVDAVRALGRKGEALGDFDLQGDGQLSLAVT